MSIYRLAAHQVLAVLGAQMSQAWACLLKTSQKFELELGPIINEPRQVYLLNKLS